MTRRRRRRSNPGTYTYKIKGARPEALLHTEIASGELVVERQRNSYEPDQEITTIFSPLRPYGVTLRYSEDVSYSRPTTFRVSNGSSLRMSDETSSAKEAVALFQRMRAEEAEGLSTGGKLLLAGAGLLGLVILSGLVPSAPASEDLASR